ncbi:MAG TPA: SMP-30/gluconolactonase/LRE family protein [Lunatimonas sp.]|nr:SMP-30/gluconolactonase/LRE family protein [Lunatimonas sp.]
MKSLIILISLLVSHTLFFQQVYGQHVKVLNNDLERLVDPNVSIEKLADGLVFTEGPVWNVEGNYLLFSDIPANTIYKWTPDGKLDTFRSPSNNANGLTYDPEGNLIIAEHSGRKIGKLSPSGAYQPLVESFKGIRFNSPNDVIVDSKGAILFTDPPYGRDKAAVDTLGFNGIFRHYKGKTTLIADDLYRPNGLTLSPDERTLYVANSGSPKKYMKYPVSKGGKVGRGSLFFDASSLEGQGNPDGIKTDTAGNLYATGPGGVLVFSPDGKHLGTIAFPESPANIAFGGPDMKTLFVTARTGLYSIQVKVPGKL